MQKILRMVRRSGTTLLAFALIFTLFAAQVDAQQPTSTDPLMRAFAAVRSALTEKFGGNFSLVQRYDWEQVEFLNGIDSCAPNSEQSNRLYFGWRFLVTALGGTQYEGRSSFDATIAVACDSITNDTTGSSAAAPPAAADGSLPPPVAGAAMTGGFELGGHVLELNANTVSIARRSGMTWVKHQVEYNLGADPGIAAGLISNAHAQGFKILVGVVGEPTQMADFPSYINSYSQFVAGVAALGADAIEVWNEPNIDREWPAGSINGANYTQLLAGAYNAIKARAANTMVISGAPAPTGFFGAAGCATGGCNDDTFMAQMAAAGAAQYMDCVGLHYNEGIISPTASSGDPRGGYPSYYFGSMLARGYNPFGGKPVCFTELGFLSPEGFNSPLPAAFGWAADTSVSEHATWLGQAATAAAQSGRVRIMIVWNVDFPFWETDPAGGYALYRPDGSCPGCDQLGAVMGAQ